MLSMNPLPNTEMHWRWPAHLPPRRTAGVKKLMREIVFKKYWQHATCPGNPQAIPDNEDVASTSSPIYQSMLQLIATCNDTWQSTWRPGDYIVADETMIHWQGTGEVHMTYQPRKPTPYGLELKTLACGEAKVVLVAELAEGKELDAAKDYREEVGASTATTLRLCRPFRGSGRCLIADSWFGSCNTAEWLWDELGIYCIMAVKTGHRGFPKALLIGDIMGARFSSNFYKIEVELETGRKTVYAGGFMDKKPMLLVATAGTSLPGETVLRQRREFKDGAIVRTQYQCT